MERRMTFSLAVCLFPFRFVKGALSPMVSLGGVLCTMHSNDSQQGVLSYSGSASDDNLIVGQQSIGYELVWPST